MKKIGVFGTCRIDNFLFGDFVKKSNTYPYIYENKNYIINVRPLGYSTTSSDVLQNINLIYSGDYKNITDNFIIHNVFLKHGGKCFITELDYDYLVIEVCSTKKIIHNNSGLIFPYEIEYVCPDNSKYTYTKEEYDETINNIIQIQKKINCKIILIPPIYIFKGNPILGVHENTLETKVMHYRLDILKRLKEVSQNNHNIILFDWNNNIKKFGIDTMLKDQFHFTEFGKKYNLKQIMDIIESKTIVYKNENVSFNIPSDNDTRHRYYKMIELRDECEKNFRLLIQYLYNNNIIDKKKNIIDLGSWIGDNTIPWALYIEGNVYAIDPSTDNIDYIETLKYLNNISNIITINKCISNSDDFVYTNDDIKHATFNVINGSIKIKTTTLDNLHKNNVIDNIGFIHLDVEGFEEKVLNGSKNILKIYKPIIVWENHLDTDNPKKIINFLNSLEYTSFVINEYFPHCRNSCRNFISFPFNNIDIINNINKYFKITDNRAEKNKPFIYI